ncbi:MAG: hypothetical protein V5A76_07840 [Candidatus Thermoplasmatota archaeon]
MINLDEKDLEADEKKSRSSNESILNQSVMDTLKNLEGKQEVYEEETVKKITSLCLKYLQDEREVPERDIKMSIYLKSLDDPCGTIIREMLKKNEGLTEREIWEMSKSALNMIGEKTDLVEITKDEDDHIYRWKR